MDMNVLGTSSSEMENFLESETIHIFMKTLTQPLCTESAEVGRGRGLKVPLSLPEHQSVVLLIGFLPMTLDVLLDHVFGDVEGMAAMPVWIGHTLGKKDKEYRGLDVCIN